MNDAPIGAHGAPAEQRVFRWALTSRRRFTAREEPREAGHFPNLEILWGGRLNDIELDVAPLLKTTTSKGPISFFDLVEKSYDLVNKQ